VKEIRRCEKGGRLPVVAVTAHAMKGDHAKALNAGCDEYLAKPIEREQLEILVEKYLERN
jgi:CheY-like chemotaxis protein